MKKKVFYFCALEPAAVTHLTTVQLLFCFYYQIWQKRLFIISSRITDQNNLPPDSNKKKSFVASCKFIGSLFIGSQLTLLIMAFKCTFDEGCGFSLIPFGSEEIK